MAKHDVTLTAPAVTSQAKPSSRQTAFVLALLALALLAPLGIYPVFLMKALCFALFASAFNLLLGYVGLLSFGHAMFFGWSAYVTAHAAKEWGLTPELAILAGMALSAVMGTVVGWLAIRRQGIYFAMITLALAQLMFFLAVQAPFTHGEDGIQGVPRGRLFGLIDLSDTVTMYYFVLAVFVAALLFLYRVVHSPFGQILKAIRDNEPRAVSLGYQVERYKLLAFVLSATLAGLAGSLKSLVFQLASLADVHWHASGEVVLMTLLGGVGTVFGPTAGAFLVVTIQNTFAEAGSWVTIIQGVIFVVCVLAFRSGIVGVVARFLKKHGIQA
ncbi:MAG TPA: branched-chain amino acid ABC transporter permease [Magnetospirillum sp.]|nr:branched-chain amino acid ABC transporter permease [Magnetospirillum sp.]